jgi:dienelactone hydrolase
MMKHLISHPIRSLQLVLILFLIGDGIYAQHTETSDFRIVEDGGTGPYSAVMLTETSLPTHTVFRPKDLKAFRGKNKLPVIVWGNGACYNSPWEHVNFLNEVASHGFLVIAIGIMPKESGEQVKGTSKATLLTEAIDWALARDKDKTSPYFGRIDSKEIAVSGMSCGGLQTLEVAGDPRVTTTVVCNSGIFKNPATQRAGMPNLTKDQLKKIHTSTLYLLGGPSDIAYQNGMDDYSQINHVPVFVANLDVGHGGTYSQPHGGEFARVATAWFKWQLKGDIQAGQLFTGDTPALSASRGWTVEKKNMP